MNAPSLVTVEDLARVAELRVSTLSAEDREELRALEALIVLDSQADETREYADYGDEEVQVAA